MSESSGPKRSVRLSTRQSMYLLRADYLAADLREFIARESAVGAISDEMTFVVDHELGERFRSAFTERLAQVGFDPRYELTEEGAVLEELIDEFFDRKTA